MFVAHWGCLTLPARRRWRSGANPKVIQRMLGHASVAMTLDVYADLFDSDFTAVADKLSETVGKMWARGGSGAI
jgi:integrase